MKKHFVVDCIVAGESIIGKSDWKENLTTSEQSAEDKKN